MENQGCYVVRSYIPSPYQGGGEVLEAVGWGGERVFESREKAMAEAKTICKALEESKPRPVPVCVMVFLREQHGETFIKDWRIEAEG